MGVRALWGYGHMWLAQEIRGRERNQILVSQILGNLSKHWIIPPLNIISEKVWLPDVPFYAEYTAQY